VPWNAGRPRPPRRPPQRKRGVYDRAVIDAILDGGLVCHVAFVHQGVPCLIPTAYAREGGWLYLHGARKNRVLRSICGQTACVSVTHVKGLVLARSAFHHSVNYRSVVLYGVGEEVRDCAEKLHAMERLVEHVVPGRWAEARQPNEQELQATIIVRLPTGECSAKVRTGLPVDDEADLPLGVWAGVLPLAQAWGAPLPDELLPASIVAPPYLVN
jgi:hypothetical protein